jgi:hypothetical protein
MINQQQTLLLKKLMLQGVKDKKLKIVSKKI